MSSETVKDLVEVNPTKGKKGKSAGKRKANPSGKKKTTKRRKNPSAKKHPHHHGKKRARRRNPGVDWKGSGAAFLGGMTGYVIGQPLATLAGGYITNKAGRAAVKIGVGALVPAALGVAAEGVGPNFGKGMVAAGGALAAAHGIAALANIGDKPNETLSKAGLTQLDGPDDIYERGGRYYRMLSTGQQQLLAGVGEAPVQLTFDDGSSETGTAIAKTPDNELVVIDGRGQTHIIPMPQTTGELVQTTGELVQTTSGTDEDDGLSYRED